MKEIKKMFIFVIFILLFLGVKVNATVRGTLIREYKDGYYYVMTSENYYRSFEIPFYTLDDYIVYCIEPGVKINTWNYIGQVGFINSPYSEEINSKLELIGHYGYGYFNHNTLNYRIATQALIWELTGNKKVEFYTKQYGYGNVIDVSYEKNEIMKLVNNHYLKPSFDSQLIIANIDEEKVLEDTNNVLEGYEVYDDGGNIVEKKENKLYIRFTSVGESQIKLRKKKYDNEESVIFVGEDAESQKVGMFRVEEDIISTINIQTIGAKVKIKKVDSEAKENIKIKGIKFKIKNTGSNEYVCENDECIFETNRDGEVITESFLVGNYQVEELENQDFNNYLWNSNPLEFSIDNNTEIIDDIYEVKFENERVKGRVEINKKGEKIVYENNTYKYEEIDLKDVVYGLYANEDIYVLDKLIYKKDELVKELVTDEYGNAILDNIELGKYYLKEISSTLGNMIDNTKYSFELKYDDKYTDEVNVNLNFKNILPKGKLIFVKTDEDSSLPIENTLIEIYSSLDNSIIYRGYTNSLGKIEIIDLPLGKYYLKEIESAIGYENTNGVIEFVIEKDRDVVRVGLTNKLIVEIPDTMLNEIDIINILGILFMVIGIGWYLYVKKK